MKKLIKDARTVVREMLEGLVDLRGRKTITESEFSTHLVFEPRWFVPYVDS